MPALIWIHCIFGCLHISLHEYLAYYIYWFFYCTTNGLLFQGSLSPRQETCLLPVAKGPCSAFMARYAFVKVKARIIGFRRVFIDTNFYLRKRTDVKYSLMEVVVAIRTTFSQLTTALNCVAEIFLVLVRQFINNWLDNLVLITFWWKIQLPNALMSAVLFRTTDLSKEAADQNIGKMLVAHQNLFVVSVLISKED